MVCVPCIVIPFLLWFFHKYIRPILIKVWPWSSQEKLEDAKNKDGTDVIKENGQKIEKCPMNGTVANGHAVTAGDGDKKTN